MSRPSALSGAILALALTASAHAATFGANVAGLFPVSQAPTSGTIAALRALRGTGATVARSDSFWTTAEPNAPVRGVHTYDWRYDDGVEMALTEAGLRWQPILDYSTPWAANGSDGPNAGVAPSKLEDYVAYARAFAARYGQGGRFWAEHPALRARAVHVFEIWNEPDLAEFWSPQPNLAEYAAMFLHARIAIKDVDPSATVIIGGLVFPMQTLPALVALQPKLRGNVDGVAVHPYRDSVPLMLASVENDLRTDAVTVGAPLYINEFGFFNPDVLWPGTSDAPRDGPIMLATAALARIPYVADVEPYCWGCGGAYDLYGTSAMPAFAAGIAADTPPPPPHTRRETPRNRQRRHQHHRLRHHQSRHDRNKR